MEGTGPVWWVPRLGVPMSTRFRILLSAAFALLGVVSCLAYANSVRDEAQRVRADAIARFGGEVAHLVVAEQALEVGDVVSERNVRLRDWVSDLAPSGAIVSLEDVVGREVRVPVAEGAPLTELNFRDEATLAEVPAGHVAVSVPVSDKLGISRGVTRGAHVSAYVVSQDGAQLIASDIEVLSELGASSGIVASQQVTIAVLPDDVSEVLGASATGDLRLVMPASDVQGAAPAATEGPPQELDMNKSSDGAAKAADDGQDAGADVPVEAEQGIDDESVAQTTGALDAPSEGGDR